MQVITVGKRFDIKKVIVDPGTAAFDTNMGHDSAPSPNLAFIVPSFK
jgi:hypothetical protein